MNLHVSGSKNFNLFSKLHRRVVEKMYCFLSPNLIHVRFRNTLRMGDTVQTSRCLQPCDIEIDLSPYSTRNCICVGYPTQMKRTQKKNLHEPQREGTQRTYIPPVHIGGRVGKKGVTLVKLGVVLGRQGVSLGPPGFLQWNIGFSI